MKISRENCLTIVSSENDKVFGEGIKEGVDGK
jgi:hypothetical protein